jgi:hypothetical protein
MATKKTDDAGADAALIQGCYQDEVKALYAVYSKGIADAAGNNVAIDGVEHRFVFGLATARSRRDRAQVLVTQ